MLRFFIALLTLPPVPASHVGAAIAGNPELGPELERISWRESRATYVSIHKRDAWASETVHGKALNRGLLSSMCPWHLYDHGGWSTRGAHGLMAGYSVHYLGPCAPAWAIDIPLLSAVAATLRAQTQCERFDACDRAGRRKHWGGGWRDRQAKADNEAEKDQTESPAA